MHAGLCGHYMKRRVSQFVEIPVVGFVAGAGPLIRQVNALLTDIACTHVPVLLVGESGTGKEVYARLLHRVSAGSSSSLKKVNCAAQNVTSFRDQIKDACWPSQGKTASPCGTLFLDEVDGLDLECQRALLSILPDEEPKDGTPELSARLVSATSQELEREIAAGRFRRDLYYRINGVRMSLPPLRERKEDIPALLHHFLEKYAAQFQKRCPPVSVEAIDLLMSHTWPGNVRELNNVARKIVALGNAEQALADLCAPGPSAAPVRDSVVTWSLKAAARAASRRIEKELILQALERTRWNRKRAAQELRISYKAFLYKLKQINVPGSDSK